MRQSTLARQLAAEADRTLFLDLENPADLAILTEPMRALADFRGLVVLDAVQRRPDLFPVLRVLADRKPRPARFLVLGSASPELLRQSSETLAGRIAFIDLAGFTLREVGAEKAGRLWQRGGFPRSFLAGSEALSGTRRDDFVRTFVERELGQLGFNLPAASVRRFWTMPAHNEAAPGGCPLPSLWNPCGDLSACSKRIRLRRGSSTASLQIEAERFFPGKSFKLRTTKDRSSRRQLSLSNPTQLAALPPRCHKRFPPLLMSVVFRIPPPPPHPPLNTDDLLAPGD